MPKKQALGRGMDAIFIDNSLESDNNTTKLPIAVIEPAAGSPAAALMPSLCHSSPTRLRRTG